MAIRYILKKRISLTIQKNKVTVANFIFDLVYFTLQVLGNGQLKYSKHTIFIGYVRQTQI